MLQPALARAAMVMARVTLSLRQVTMAKEPLLTLKISQVASVQHKLVHFQAITNKDFTDPLILASQVLEWTMAQASDAHNLYHDRCSSSFNFNDNFFFFFQWSSLPIRSIWTTTTRIHTIPTELRVQCSIPAIATLPTFAASSTICTIPTTCHTARVQSIFELASTAICRVCTNFFYLLTFFYRDFNFLNNWTKKKLLLLT